MRLSFLPSSGPVPAPEKFSLAVGGLPVADVAGADHRAGSAGPGSVCCSPHDDRLHQPSSSRHLSTGCGLFRRADRDPADQVSVLFVYLSHLFRFQAASFGILMSHMMITVSDETNNVSK